MGAYISYPPTTIITKAMFNFDEFGLLNYKLDGTVRVSVSDAFSFADYMSPDYSDFYPGLYTAYSNEVPWSTQMTNNIVDILEIYSRFADISFQWVGDYDTFTSGSDFTPNPEDVGRANLSDINITWIYRADGSFAGISGANSDIILGYTGAAGDVFLNSYAPNFDGDYTFDLNTRARQILMHELGHSLGLSHPHSAYNNGVPTITADYAAVQDLGFDQLGFNINSATDLYKEYFTIMSYDDQQSLFPGSNVIFHAHTPMILDVIALQQAYGDGTGTSGSGNDTITAGNLGYRTYFDTGGIDTIDLSLYSTLLDGAFLNMGTDITGAGHMVGVSMIMYDAFDTILYGGNPDHLRWFYGEYENANGSSNIDFIIGNSLQNVINGQSGDDFIFGGDGNDTLNGGVGNDELYGDSGNDLFDWDVNARDGADTMYGGPGDDQYVIDSQSDVVVELSGEGSDVIWAEETYSIANIENVENLFLFGSLSVNVTGNALANVVRGNDANNILDGGGGDDTLYGGDGDDTYFIDSAGDIVTEEANAGNDSVYAWFDYTLEANVENLIFNFSETPITGTGNGLNNYIEGNNKDNTLYGLAGNDNLIGNDSNDTIDGGDGNDHLYGRDGNDHLYGDEGNDQLDGGWADDSLSGGWGDDTLDGDEGEDILSGNDGNDTLYGGWADDTLDGGEGADTMDGGYGNDTLYGGNLDDTAVYRGTLGEYTVSYNYSTRIFTISDDISSRDGSDELSDIEYFQFFDGLKLASEFADIIAPTVSSFNPTDGATDVSTTANIVVTFSEAIQRGTGSIVLENAAGTTIETFNAAGSNRLSISGSTLTIDPTNILANSKKYYVTFAPGTIKDLVGNAYVGTTSYDFTTAAVVAIPTLDPSFSPVFPNILEGAANPAGVTVKDLIVDGSIFDEDGSVEAIAIEALNISLGTWQYSMDSGATWLTVRADLINSTTNNLALLLGPTDQIRLLSFGDLNGSLTDAITFRAWNMSSGSAGQYVVTAPGIDAFSSASDTANISVTPVNDAPTFAPINGTGKVIVDVDSDVDLAYAVTLQPDGKIVVAGQSGYVYSLIRLNADGTLDTSFDDDGKLIIDISGGPDYGRAVTLQPDGKIVVAGVSGYGYYSLIRLNADGTLDTSFDGDGKLIMDVYDGEGHSITLQPDGQILVAGQSGTGALCDYSLIRLNADGTLDTSFDGDGKLIVDVGSGSDSAYAVTLQPDGKIVVAGGSFVGGAEHRGYDYSLIRLNADGTLDTSFDGDGKLILDIGDYHDWGRAVTLQPDGKIVVAGGSDNCILIRLNADGTLDTSFDGDGKLIIDVGSGSDSVYAVTLQPDGKIVVAGGSGYSYSLIRLNADGTLDTSFDGDGKLILQMGNDPNFHPDYGRAVTLQPDGKIVMAGSSFSGWGSGYDYSLIRLNADGSLDTTFNGSSLNTLGAIVSYTENAATIALDNSVAIYDVDLAAFNGGMGNYSGASVNLSRHGGISEQDMFSNLGNLVLTGNGGDAVLSGVTVGTFTNTDGRLSITFNANATQARVNELLSSIGYANTSDVPTTNVQIDWTFSDGNSGRQGTGDALIANGSTTVNIANIDDEATGTLSMAGTVAEGGSLVASLTGVVDTDGSASTTYLWQENTGSVESPNWVAISGANTETLVIPSDQGYVGKNVRVVASTTDALGGTTTFTGDAMSIANVNDASTGSVTISGSATQGQTLTAANTLVDLDGLGAISYQWSANGAAISGATDSTYLLTQAEVGKTITVAASYSDAYGVAESVTSAATAAVGLLSTGTANAETLNGTSGDDYISGLGGNDNLCGGDGNDTLVGGEGTDTVVMRGIVSQYQFNQSSGNTVVTSHEGTDTLTSVEYIRFGSSAYTTDVPLSDSTTINPVRLSNKITDLYVAYFNRGPDAEGFDYWFHEIYTSTKTLRRIAEDFAWSNEYQSMYPGTLTNKQFVEQIYLNLFDRTPDQGGWDYWSGRLDTGSVKRSGFILDVIEGAYAPTSGPEDRTLIDNKHDASLYYTGQLAINPQEGFDFAIVDLLNRVTGDVDTVAAAERVIDYAFDEPVTLTGVITNHDLFDSLWMNA